MADRDIFGGRPTGQHPNPRMRGRSGGIESLRRPEDFTNLNMLGRPDLSFRYSHMEPGREENFFGSPEDASIRGTWRRTEDARRFEDLDEYGYLEGVPRQRTIFSEGSIGPNSFNEMYGGVYDDAIFRTVDPNTNKLEYGAVPGSVDTNDLGEGFYRSDGEFVEAPLGGFDDRLDSIMSNWPTTYEGFSPGYPNTLDVRYPGDFNAQQNQGRPYGGSGQPSHGYWQQMRVPEELQRERHLQRRYGDPPYGQSDTFTNPYYPEKKHPNPRMRGIGSLQEQETAGLWQDIKRILLNTKNPGPLIDQWTDYYNRELT